jgi:hypothetical protein
MSRNVITSYNVRRGGVLGLSGPLSYTEPLKDYEGDIDTFLEEERLAEMYMHPLVDGRTGDGWSAEPLLINTLGGPDWMESQIRHKLEVYSRSMLSSLKRLIGPIAVKSKDPVGQADSRVLKKYVIEFSGSQLKFQAALEILNRKMREHYIEAVASEFISSPIRITACYIDVIILAKPHNPNGKLISIESSDDYAAYVDSEDNHKRFGQFEPTNRLVKFHEEVQVRLMDELSVF